MKKLFFVLVVLFSTFSSAMTSTWQKTFGGSKWDEAGAIIPTKDNGFIVTGLTFSFGNGKGDVYLIKIDKNGNKIWQKTFGGSKNDEAYAITPTKDGGFIVAGYTESFGNGKDVYLIKIDKNGNKIWQKTFGGSKNDEADAITSTKDGGFIVAGYTDSFGNGEYDVYLIKIDKNGNSSSKDLKIASHSNSSSDSSYSVEKSYSLKYCYNGSGGARCCRVIINGEDKGSICYEWDSHYNHYSIFPVFGAKIYENGYYDPNLHMIWTTKCGKTYTVYSTSSALNKFLNCVANGHY